MTSPVSTITGAEWIRAVLSADSTLMAMVPGGIFQGNDPPLSLPMPLIQVFMSSGTPLKAIGSPNNVIYTDAVYTVKVVMQYAAPYQDGFSDMKPIVQRMKDTLLDGSGTAVADGQVFMVDDENAIQYTEPPHGGQRWYHAGNEFRVYVR